MSTKSADDMGNKGSGMPQNRITDDGQSDRPRRELPLSLVIHQLSLKIDAQGRALVARHSDLTLPQWRVIRVIGLEAPDGSTALRKLMGFDKSQFSKTVNQLRARGLLAVSAHPEDGRQLQLSLTEAGRAVLDRLGPVLDARNDLFLQALAPEELKVIRSALSKLGRAAEITDFSKGDDE
ncbi:MarR family winged helix-turn-helix transcriptional regulator [Pararhodobacter marinus]|uniref:MarR family winged helix-turn-helix transcriptional regulator n=1 Tax=Pararhodobacter marinus TaxID=2184063 RepID=UPI003518546A